MAKKRGNNEGSITRRPDGRWMAQVTIGRDPATGKPRRATFYGKTRQDVADKLTKALRDKQQGTFVAPHKLTLGEWLETWLWEYKAPRVRPATFAGYEMIVRRHLTPALGHIALQDLRPEHIQHSLNTRFQEGMAPKTICGHRLLLVNALARAEKNGLVARNVCSLVEPPRYTRKDMRVLTMEQMTTRLLPALTGHRLSAVFLTLFLVGLRRGELLGLRWQDVDMKAQADRNFKRHSAGRREFLHVCLVPQERALRSTAAPPACGHASPGLGPRARPGPQAECGAAWTGCAGGGRALGGAPGPPAFRVPIAWQSRLRFAPCQALARPPGRQPTHKHHRVKGHRGLRNSPEQAEAKAGATVAGRVEATNRRTGAVGVASPAATPTHAVLA